MTFSRFLIEGTCLVSDIEFHCMQIVAGMSVQSKNFRVGIACGGEAQYDIFSWGSKSLAMPLIMTVRCYYSSDIDNNGQSFLISFYVLYGRYY